MGGNIAAAAAAAGKGSARVGSVDIILNARAEYMEGGGLYESTASDNCVEGRDVVSVGL